MLLHALWLIAITAEAMTAALEAGRRSMDWIGVCMLALRFHWNMPKFVYKDDLY